MVDLPPIAAWLASGRFDYSPAPGQVQLKDDRIIFTVVAPPGNKNANWLEKVTGDRGLAQRVLKGEAAGAVKVRFPRFAVGSAMQVKHDGTTYRIFFYNSGRAVGGGASGVSSQLQGRVAGKPWREAFKGPLIGAKRRTAGRGCALLVDSGRSRFRPGPGYVVASCLLGALLTAWGLGAGVVSPRGLVRASTGLLGGLGFLGGLEVVMANVFVVRHR